jgi:hypothetical protein
MIGVEQDNPTSYDDLRQRFDRPPAPDGPSGLCIERGSLRDYRRLSGFHYKSAHPGAPTTVYRLVHDKPTVVGRFLSRPGERALVGVLVRALPHLACRLRNVAMSDRYAGLPLKDSAAMLNREFRTITRTIIAPEWRGIGLAVRLVRHALDRPETVFTEAFAAMGRVHPFLERAGMVRYDRPPRPDQSRLLDALDRLGIDPMHLASRELVTHLIAQRSDADRRWLRSELCRWHRAVNRTARDRLARLTMEDLLADARVKLLSQPVYYLFDHRKAAEGRTHAADCT